MQCGYPGPGPLSVSFPAAVRLPAGITRTEVLVDGHPAPAVALSGQELTVTLPAPPQVMCDVIGPGRLTVEVEASAGIGNPARSGTYTLRVSRDGQSFSARFRIAGA